MQGKGGQAHILYLEKGRGVLSEDDRVSHCIKGVQAVLDYYRCEMTADIPEDSIMWVEAIQDERLN